jgi:hypothetical protein
MNRLTTVWLQGAARNLGAIMQSTSSATRMHRYLIDGADESLFWIESADRSAAQTALSELSLPIAETFTFDLVRDVGNSLASPAQWLYLVHTDIPAHIVDDYNAWYDDEHLPRLVRVSGVERARRYVADPGLSPHYLTA